MSVAAEAFVPYAVENQEYLLMIARYGTAAQVEKLVRLYRGVQRDQERDKALGQHDWVKITMFGIRTWGPIDVSEFGKQETSLFCAFAGYHNISACAVSRYLC